MRKLMLVLLTVLNVLALPAVAVGNSLFTLTGQQETAAEGRHRLFEIKIDPRQAINAASSGTLQIATPNDGTLILQYMRHQIHPNGDLTWIGRLPGALGSEDAIITIGQDATFGIVPQRDGPPLRITKRHGRTWLVQTSADAPVSTLPHAMRADKTDFFVPPPLGSAHRPASSKFAAHAPPVALDGSSSTPVVDVMVVYTNGMVTQFGSDAAVQTRINFLIDVTNEAYSNSSMNTQVRLVHTVKVTYPDNTSNDTALSEISGYESDVGEISVPASLASIRSLRDQYGADLVSFLRVFKTPENESCGVAWLNGADQAPITTADEFFGYSVVSDGTDVDESDNQTYYCRDEAFAHELGHNMGSSHDIGNSGGTGGAYVYSYGWKVASQFYTVMAYGDDGQTGLRVFSNPLISTCLGLPCGVTNQADNAKSIGLTFPTIATFRPTAVVTPDPPRTYDLFYTMITPCRILDTRLDTRAAPNGGAIPVGGTHSFKASVSGAGVTFQTIGQGGSNGACGIPANPAAVAMNVTVLNPVGGGYLTVFPYNVTRPATASLNYPSAGAKVGNEIIVNQTIGETFDFSIYSANQTDVVADAVGYFMAPVATALDTIQVLGTPSTAATNGSFVVTATCTSGYTLSGGGNTASVNYGVSLNQSAAADTVTWTVRGKNIASTSNTMRAVALCSRVPGR